MSLNIDKAWIRSIIPDFLKPAHAGGLIRLGHFKKEIRNINFTHVMDAGCGGGQYSFYLAKLNPSADITAYDINKHQIEQNKIKNKEILCACSQKTIEYFIWKDMTFCLETRL